MPSYNRTRLVLDEMQSTVCKHMLNYKQSYALRNANDCLANFKQDCDALKVLPLLW